MVVFGALADEAAAEPRRKVAPVLENNLEVEEPNSVREVAATEDAEEAAANDEAEAAAAAARGRVASLWPVRPSIASIVNSGVFARDLTHTHTHDTKDSQTPTPKRGSGVEDYWGKEKELEPV